ncbi:MAG: glycosyltransferase, partial [Promethearchaeota archaeon]
MAKRKGLWMGRVWQSKFTNKWSKVVCEELPRILQREKIDFIICDQLEPAVALVADYLGIPFVTICNAMAIVMHETYPPFFTNWDYDVSERRLNINKGFYKIANFLLNRDTHILEKWRKKWGMPERIGMKRYFAYSTLATISQQTKSIEFPLTEINADWYYCGPFRTNGLLPYSKPKLPKDEITNVYISLGTIQGARFKLFKKCAEACNELGVRAIIVHAGLLEEKKIKELEKIAIVYDYVKQPDIFDDCEILISHCGLNTALDAMSYGRPIIAIPIGIEQGAIATKLKRIGCAIVVKKPNKKNLKQALSEVLSNAEYKEKCQLIKKEIESSGGTERAVEIIYNLINNKTS